jgi:hypothetical protein
MRPSNKTVRALALVAVLAALGGCSEYTDRRDTIALSGGNAVASDTVTQMVDPWPAYSGDRNIAFNGQKMQGAVQRYRTNQVTPPVGTGTSGTYQQQQGATNNPMQADPTASQPGPVKSP